MLESIINSKLKKAVLAVLLLYPKRSFAPQELAAMVHGPLRQVHESLRDLGRAEVVEIAAKKGRRYYRVNSYFPLLHELRELAFDPKPRYDDGVAKRLRQLSDLRLIVLSGIFTAAARQPLDILLVGDAVSRPKLTRAIEEIEDLTGQEVSYALLPKDEYQERLFMNDRMIRELAAHDGVMQVNYHVGFLSQAFASAESADDGRIDKAMEAIATERCGENEACLILTGGQLARERVAAGTLPRVEWPAIADHIEHAA